MDNHHMHKLFKILLMIVLLAGGQSALASPRDDAIYIAQRRTNPEQQAALEGFLRDALVDAYFRPLSGPGIEIADKERFMELIPDEDIAPYMEHYFSHTVQNYLSIYDSEQLAALAGLLHSFEDTPVDEILSRDFQDRLQAALETRAPTPPISETDAPADIAVKELVVQLDAFVTFMDVYGTERFAQDFSVSIGSLVFLTHYGQEIRRLRPARNNPVTLSAIQADGVLQFANRVQQQTLLTELQGSEDTGGIHFIKPPAGNQ